MGEFIPDKKFSKEIYTFNEGDIEACYKAAVMLANAGTEALDTLAFIMINVAEKDRKQLAARAMIKIEDPAIGHLISLLEEDELTAIAAGTALVTIGKPVLPKLKLTRMSYDPMVETRVNAVINTIISKEDDDPRSSGSQIRSKPNPPSTSSAIVPSKEEDFSMLLRRKQQEIISKNQSVDRLIPLLGKDEATANAAAADLFAIGRLAIPKLKKSRMSYDRVFRNRVSEILDRIIEEYGDYQQNKIYFPSKQSRIKKIIAPTKPKKSTPKKPVEKYDDRDSKTIKKRTRHGGPSNKDIDLHRQIGPPMKYGEDT